MNADFGGTGERIAYGNPAGRTLSEEKHDMKERMTRLEDKLQKTNTQVTDLQNRVKTLTLASEGYRKIRQ